MPEIRTLQDHGINWIWYLQGIFDDQAKTVEILLHDRWHKYDSPRHPVSMPSGYTIVDDGTPKRIASQVFAAGTIYTVTNPKCRFDYNDRSHLVLEP